MFGAGVKYCSYLTWLARMINYKDCQVPTLLFPLSGGADSAWPALKIFCMKETICSFMSGFFLSIWLNVERRLTACLLLLGSLRLCFLKGVAPPNCLSHPWRPPCPLFPEKFCLPQTWLACHHVVFAGGLPLQSYPFHETGLSVC